MPFVYVRRSLFSAVYVIFYGFFRPHSFGKAAFVIVDRFFGKISSYFLFCCKQQPVGTTNVSVQNHRTFFIMSGKRPGAVGGNGKNRELGVMGQDRIEDGKEEEGEEEKSKS